MVPIEVEEFAKKQGYETAEFSQEWKGYNCYGASYCKDELAIVGLPALILVDADSNMRMASYEEVMEWMDE